jgi:tRNA dimethylallyltransferase
LSQAVPPVLIAGPTASGKSSLALALAVRDHGVVINADALQVYAQWRVLSARPSEADEARVPHALYGHVEAEASYSVGHWLREVENVLASALAMQKRAIVVGGTGLYFTSMLAGLAPVPPVPPEVRAEADALLAAGGLGRMRAELARRDPETYAAIDVRNPVRIARAWEVLTATGRGLAAWRKVPVKPVLRAADCVRIVVSPDPARLAGRIETRFRTMIDCGALEEVRRALDAGWNPRRPSSKALGADRLVAHLKGETTLDEAISASVIATRQYAKRQRTWFRRHMADWVWTERGEDMLAEIPST